MCDAQKNPPRRSSLWFPSLYQIEPDETVSPQLLDTCITLRLKTTTAHELVAHGPLMRGEGRLPHRSRKFVADDNTTGSFASKSLPSPLHNATGSPWERV